MKLTGLNGGINTERKGHIDTKNDSYVFGLSRGCVMSLLNVTEDTGRETGMWVWGSSEIF